MLDSAKDVRRSCRRISRVAALAEELDARGLDAAARKVGGEIPALLKQNYAVTGRLMRELGVRQNSGKRRSPPKRRASARHASARKREGGRKSA